MARVIDITQEWRIERVFEHAEVCGVYQLRPMWDSQDRWGKQTFGGQKGSLEDSGYRTYPKAGHKNENSTNATYLRRTMKEVEADWVAAQQHRLLSRSTEARLIERAIWDISERISQQRGPLTRAQAEAREEMLRTRLAEMILNLGPEQDVDYDYGRVLKEPILILKDKLQSLQAQVDSAAKEEEESIREELKFLTIPRTAPSNAARIQRHDYVDEVKRKEKEAHSKRRHSRADISARMTPLIALVHRKLESLEGVVS